MLHYHNVPHLSVIAAITNNGHGVVDVVAAVSVGVVTASLVIIDSARVVKHVGSLKSELGLINTYRKHMTILTMMAVAVGFM